MSEISHCAEAGLARVGGAKCEAERDLGYLEKKFMVEMTRGKEVLIAREYGEDRYGRLVVDLSVGSKSLSQEGIEAGHLKPRPHKSGRALQSKRDWCGEKCSILLLGDYSVCARLAWDMARSASSRIGLVCDQSNFFKM